MVSWKILLPVLACFGIGVSWGHWSTSRARWKMAQTTPMRVLCHDSWLSQEVLNDFAKRHSTPIQIWTYSNPGEFLRQMANADGKIDVVCTSSFLIKSLIQSQWVRKTDFLKMENTRFIAVDFLHLPYDKNSEYSVPLFWNLHGFFGKGDKSSQTWKQTFASKKVSLWGDELSMLQALGRTGVKIEERLQDQETRNLETDIKNFVRSAAEILVPNIAPVTAENVIARADWVSLPLARVARLLGENSPYQFWLPSDGGAIETGLLAIGSNAAYPELAEELINELISTELAMHVHKHTGAGVVHESLSHHSSIAPLQKAAALRKFPLNKIQFPDLSLEALPRFQRILDETKTAKQ